MAYMGDRITRHHYTSLVPGVQGAASISLWDEDAGAGEAYTGGTYTLIAPDGSTAASVSLGSGTGEVTALLTPDAGLAYGVYKERWDVTISGYIPRADFTAIIGPAFFVPRISTDDLTSLNGDLKDAYDPSVGNWQRQIDEAFHDVLTALVARTAVTEAWTSDHISQPTVELAMAYCFRAMGRAYREERDAHYQRAWDAFERMVVQLEGDSGARAGASPAVVAGAGMWPPPTPWSRAT